MSRVSRTPPGLRAGHPAVRGSFRRPPARPDASRPASAAPAAPAARPRSAGGPPSASRPATHEGMFAKGGPPAPAVVPDAVPYPFVPEADRASTTAGAHPAPTTAAADSAAKETS